MRIIKLEIMRLAMPFETGREVSKQAGGDVYNAASPELSKMESLLVTLTTDTGLTGWGESFGHLINPVTFSALKDSVGRFFMGKQVPTTKQELVTLMDQAKYAFHAFGCGGPVMYALSGIDIALWDLLAKQAGKPLYQYLGGNRSVIGGYASLVRYEDKVEQHVKRALADGFTEIKLHEIEVPYIQAARDALPVDGKLMVDVNCPWTLEQTENLAPQLRTLNLTWLEEPLFPPNDLKKLAKLREQGIPIAAGENIDGVQGIEAHLMTQSVDILQPSVAKIGGISAMLATFELAKQYNIKVVPHCFYYGAGLLATAHLISLLDESVKVELPYIQWSTHLFPEMKIGPVFNLPDKPGLGFEPDIEVLQNHLIAYVNLEI
ncbi:mandelate racemase/muconate lactonizing enzyme family protein [Zophobihabitans entericus]|uniref:Mandelate racemase/muconate lactonizing enzyme family protein n=1 Tax=Zophobihabitans entericus TaxID=1635327 RepID=A0A6G9IA68_9GAMM|nr:mandelate racemase/muconate lactonizing enzyme family protein [Zophobihabitans entericus]QIQ21128.1 mandelate racemase/muconate lactonizing enzyme family protein [Zophobihabitans entericus]